MKRSFNLWAVLVAVVVLAAACGSSAKPSAQSGSTPTTGAKKITTVRLLTHSSFAASKDVLADFTNQTGYKVKLVQPGDAGVMVNWPSTKAKL